MANMFRCVLASGGALILTVTCDSAFSGQTITCTDGTTTLTQICPSTSPYTVEFRIPNSGTWTISSGTTSTSVTIPSSAELHDIPNGSTITPTDVIQTWLHCGNIWDKNYTTISQVLADASTLQALIASTNAVDYMARSTTWVNAVCADSSAMTYIGLNDYCANTLLADSTWRNAICNSAYVDSVLNVKVPTMTSNTTPSGECFGSSKQSSDYYYAFDGNDSRGWYPQSSDNDQYCGYEFTNSHIITIINHLFTIGGGTGANDLKVKYQAYNGSTWVDLTDEITIADNLIYNEFLSSNTAYSKYRVIPTQGAINPMRGVWYKVNMQFYGRS